MNATNCGLLALIVLPLAFAVGCGDPNDNNGNETVDTGDDPVTEFEATIVSTTPFEGVEVTVDGIDADCSGTSCIYPVDEAGTYDVQAWGTYTFVPKTVDIVDPGEYFEQWAEGGCASNPNWDATTECDEWVPGEYGMVTFDGERNCVDEIWGREAEIEFVVTDEAITISGISTLHDGTMSSNNFYGSDQERDTWFAGNITENGAFHVYMWNTSEVVEYLYYCD